MTTPATPDPSADPATPSTPAPGSRRSRPRGPTGGHTVQDWEQPVQRQGQPPAQPRASEAPLALVDPDEPSPPTVPRYLRSGHRPGARKAAKHAVPFDARTGILTAQSAALVDALTRGVADALAVSLRPIVDSTVQALIPMILSLGSVPDPEPVQAEPADPADQADQADQPIQAASVAESPAAGLDEDAGAGEAA